MLSAYKTNWYSSLSSQNKINFKNKLLGYIFEPTKLILNQYIFEDLTHYTGNFAKDACK